MNHEQWVKEYSWHNFAITEAKWGKVIIIMDYLINVGKIKLSDLIF